MTFYVEFLLEPCLLQKGSRAARPGAHRFPVGGSFQYRCGSSGMTIVPQPLCDRVGDGLQGQRPEKA